jgi:hypothetical protein
MSKRMMTLCVVGERPSSSGIGFAWALTEHSVADDYSHDVLAGMESFMAETTESLAEDQGIAGSYER